MVDLARLFFMINSHRKKTVLTGYQILFKKYIKQQIILAGKDK